MQDADLELLEEFVVESRELLEQAEADLMALDLTTGEAPDQEVINGIFRAVHSVKGSAGFFGLVTIGHLSHALESVLMKVRDGQLRATHPMVDVLLKANDRLRALVEDIQGSNDQDVEAEVEALQDFLEEGAQAPPPASELASIPGLDPSMLDDFGPILGAEDDGPAPPAPGPTGQVPVGPFELTEAIAEDLLRNGRKLLALTVRVSEDLDHLDRSATQFLEEAGALGDILHVSDEPDTLRSGAYTVHLTTVLDPGLAAEGFQLAEAQIAEVSLGDGPAEATPTPDLEAPSPAAPKPTASSRSKGPAMDKSHTETVRIKTSVLNELMEMAGELVLARNRLVRTLSTEVDDLEGLGPVLSQVSSITTNVQEQIMRTRLQPISALFGKFRRVVRDVSGKLGKEVVLETHGGDVELDRTILEGLSDPLTHLLRNSLDHGLEPPNERDQHGKPRAGTITLSAYHEAGMVNIDIVDDGRGIDVDRVIAKALERGLLTEEQAERMGEREKLALIFAAGFSTAAVVTDVSGRGVGMDVVRTNIEKLGGTVDLASERGVGTTVTLKLPLTLAIVSSLILEAENQRFALPQVGLQEVIRLRPGEGSEVIEEVRGAAVLRHRGQLLPIVRLADALDLERTYVHPESGARLPDGRDRLVDRRASTKHDPPPEAEQRSGVDRRQSLANVQRILVLKLGRNRYGLMVDRILDNEEIVVKPLSRFVRSTPCFSGATILGDGTISMILDVMGISEQAKLRFDLTQDARDDIHGGRDRDLRERVSLVLFSNGTEETFAVPLGQIARIEKIDSSSIQRIGGREYLTYLGSSLPLVRLQDFLPVDASFEEKDELYVLIPKIDGQQVGLVVSEVIDAQEVALDLDPSNVVADGMFGTTILDGRIVLVVDIHRLAALAEPDSVGNHDGLFGPEGPLNLLLAEDTPAYQVILRSYLERAGANVTLAPDGEEAWEKLRTGAFDALVTDVVMPRIHGSALVARMRSHNLLGRVPAVLLGSTGREDDPFTKNASKLDSTELVQTIQVLVGEVS